MKEKLTLIIKGFIIGIGKIIPGVSGAMMAICLGVYDRGLESITNFFSNMKENMKFLFYLMIGFSLGIILFSKIIYYFLDRYSFITMFFFIGLLCGGFINIYRNIERKNYLLIIVTSLLLFLISISNINNNYILHNNINDYIVFLFGGLVDAFATVVPGVSGMALLSLFGIYDKIILFISNMSHINLLIFFGLGLFLGIILISIIINKLLNKYFDNTYSVIIGIIISSIFLLIIKVFSIKFTIIDLVLGVFLFIFGYILSFYLDR